LAQEIIEVPITGKIISVDTKVGDEVQEGDVICFIESMKMENPILAPVNGKITDIQISVDEVVETGKVIAIIEY
jgi:glutaconyl-CoA decarboxylase